MISRFPSLFIIFTALCLCGTSAEALAQISVRSPLSDDRYVAPGTQYSGQILIKNETESSQQARIYQTDYRFSADGSNYYNEPGTDGRSNADWTRVSASVITLPPKEIVPVEYLVSVPEDSDSLSLEGSYWNMIMIEAIPSGSIESTLEDPTGSNKHGVKQILRYGIQVATHISDSGNAALQLENVELFTDQTGNSTVSLHVENEGTKFVRPHVWIELYTGSGQLVDRFDGARSRIYPDTSVRQQFDLGKLASGDYRALLILDAGSDELFGSEFDLAIDY